MELHPEPVAPHPGLYVVNQPMGVVAGMWQYKHAHVSIFEGYGGSVASGFRDEVERETLRKRLNLARELYHDRAEGRLWSGAGKGAQAIDRELDAVRALFAGIVMARRDCSGASRASP